MNEEFVWVEDDVLDAVVAGRGPRMSGADRRKMAEELLLARRYLAACGRNSWPTEDELLRMEAEQDEMRREYEADVRREGGGQ